MNKKHILLPLAALFLFLFVSCAKPFEDVGPADTYTEDSTNDHWMKGC